MKYYSVLCIKAVALLLGVGLYNCSGRLSRSYSMFGLNLGTSRNKTSKSSNKPIPLTINNHAYIQLNGEENEEDNPTHNLKPYKVYSLKKIERMCADPKFKQIMQYYNGPENHNKELDEIKYAQKAFNKKFLGAIIDKEQNNINKCIMIHNYFVNGQKGKNLRIEIETTIRYAKR